MASLSGARSSFLRQILDAAKNCLVDGTILFQSPAVLKAACAPHEMLLDVLTPSMQRCSGPCSMTGMRRRRAPFQVLHFLEPWNQPGVVWHITSQALPASSHSYAFLSLGLLDIVRCRTP